MLNFVTIDYTKSSENAKKNGKEPLNTSSSKLINFTNNDSNNMNMGRHFSMATQEYSDDLIRERETTTASYAIPTWKQKTITKRKLVGLHWVTTTETIDYLG